MQARGGLIRLNSIISRQIIAQPLNKHVFAASSSRCFTTSAITRNATAPQTAHNQVPPVTNIINNTSATETTTTTSQNVKPRGRLLFITLLNSRFHKNKHLTEAFKVLGLNKIDQTVVHKDTPAIRGLVFRVRNFIGVESVSTAELFPEGTEHIQIERKSRNEMRRDWIDNKKEERKKTLQHLEEAERILAEYKAKRDAATQQQ